MAQTKQKYGVVRHGYACGDDAGRDNRRHHNELAVNRTGWPKPVDLQELAERLRHECSGIGERLRRSSHTVEEAYEVADAALAEDDAKLLDELGDLLSQTFFLSLLQSAARSRAGRPDHPREACPPPPARLRRGRTRFRRRGEASVGGDRAEEGREGIPSRSETLQRCFSRRKCSGARPRSGFEYPDRKRAPISRQRVAGFAEPRDSSATSSLPPSTWPGISAWTRSSNSGGPALASWDASSEAAELASAEGLDFDQLELDEQDRWYDLAKEGEQSD